MLERFAFYAFVRTTSGRWDPANGFETFGTGVESIVDRTSLVSEGFSNLCVVCAYQERSKTEKVILDTRDSLPLLKRTGHSREVLPQQKWPFVRGKNPPPMVGVETPPSTNGFPIVHGSRVADAVKYSNRTHSLFWRQFHSCFIFRESSTMAPKRGSTKSRSRSVIPTLQGLVRKLNSTHSPPSSGVLRRS